MATRWGGFLEDVDRFDARFFRISPREAIAMDPQQRLLLEVSWAALEHAAIDPTGLAGTQTGVFVGTDHPRLRQGDLPRRSWRGSTRIVRQATSPTWHRAASPTSTDSAGRASTVDTACSSSLVAVHLACQSLSSGESEMALAAGVNLILAPDGSIAVSRAHMLSPDGRCKTFDRSRRRLRAQRGVRRGRVEAMVESGGRRRSDPRAHPRIGGSTRTARAAD